MYYTDEKAPPATVYPMRTLQVFSVRVAEIKEGLHWPLDVYGIVAARDSLDHNRNIIFNRTRDNCQTIDMEVCILVADSYFVAGSTFWSGRHLTLNNIIVLGDICSN